MNGQYEVLNPWAEVDPIPLRGISPRLTDLPDKTIGLYSQIRKRTSHPMQTVVEKKLKERFPTVKLSHFLFDKTTGVSLPEDKARLEEWLKGVDAVITAVGD